MVVADTATQARDAVEAIGVTWEDLPAVVDVEAAIAPDAPAVFDGAPGNVAYDTHIGDKEKTDAVFASAPHKVRIKIVNPRVVANYMEPRSAVGEHDPTTGWWNPTRPARSVLRSTPGEPPLSCHFDAPPALRGAR